MVLNLKQWETNKKKASYVNGTVKGNSAHFERGIHKSQCQVSPCLFSVGEKKSRLSKRAGPFRGDVVLGVAKEKNKKWFD